VHLVQHGEKMTARIDCLNQVMNTLLNMKDSRPHIEFYMQVLGGCRNNSTEVADSSFLTKVSKGRGEIERPIEHIVMLQHSNKV
jgi:hypothetical protein